MEESIKNGIKCPNCEKMLKNRQNLKMHISAVHNEMSKKCPRCLSDIKCTKKFNVSQHMKNCMASLFICHCCLKKSYKMDIFLKHYATHPQWERKLNLAEIKRFHIESKKDRFVCKFCEKTYSSKATLSGHLRKSSRCKGKKRPMKMPNCRYRHPKKV